MFLLRTLLRRLALGLPTVLQLHPSWALLFHSGGVREFAQLDDWSAHAPLKPPPEHNPLSRIWALMDSKYLRTPAPIFADGLFVVQTASPHPGRQEWAGGDRINQFYMEPWSFSEVLQAWVNFPPVIHHIYISAAAILSNRTLRARRSCGTCTRSMAHLQWTSTYLPMRHICMMN